MQFNSFIFILMFLPITVLTYFLTSKFKPVLGKIVIIAASVIFYAYSDLKIFTVIGISLIVNLGFALLLQKLERFNRLFLAVPIVINVGLLLYFKYTNFFITVINQYAGKTCELRILSSLWE